MKTRGGGGAGAFGFGGVDSTASFAGAVGAAVAAEGEVIRGAFGDATPGGGGGEVGVSVFAAAGTGAVPTASFLVGGFFAAVGAVSTGFVAARFVVAGFAATGFVATGFVVAGLVLTGFAATGFAATGFAATGFVVAGFAVTGFAVTGFVATGFVATGFVATGFVAGVFELAVFNGTGFVAAVVFIDVDGFGTVLPALVGTVFVGTVLVGTVFMAFAGTGFADTGLPGVAACFAEIDFEPPGDFAGAAFARGVLVGPDFAVPPTAAATAFAFEDPAPELAFVAFDTFIAPFDAHLSDQRPFDLTADRNFQRGSISGPAPKHVCGPRSDRHDGIAGRSRTAESTTSRSAVRGTRRRFRPWSFQCDPLSCPSTDASSIFVPPVSSASC